MKHNPYPSYKDSGVEWLGDVPEHWEVTTVRRIANAVQTGCTPSIVISNDKGSKGIYWYTPGDFGSGIILKDSSRSIPDSGNVTSDGVKIFPAGSVLIVSIGATLGRIGLAEFECSANQQINAIIPNSDIDSLFLAYSLCVKQEMMRFLSNASTIGIMNQDKTKEIFLLCPSFPEQQVIAAFLDRETAKIDELVAEQERLIELLTEKRQAVISHAVTRGLNGSSPKIRRILSFLP